MAKLPTPPPNIPEYGAIEPTKGFEKEGKTTIPDKGAFEEHMQAPLEQEASIGKELSPVELGQMSQTISAPTPETLLRQVGDHENLLKETKEKLQTKNLKFKNSQEKLLNSKFQEATENLKSAAKYSNAKIVEDTTPQKKGPVSKFINYLADGENQLYEVKKRLEHLQSKQIQLKPSELMLIQVNIAQAQQSIEFSSILISKVTDAIKQMLSIQL